VNGAPTLIRRDSRTQYIPQATSKSDEPPYPIIHIPQYKAHRDEYTRNGTGKTNGSIGWRRFVGYTNGFNDTVRMGTIMAGHGRGTCWGYHKGVCLPPF
jgi:hypothetical protein